MFFQKRTEPVSIQRLYQADILADSDRHRLAPKHIRRRTNSARPTR
ncbi:MAG: hypothetical protein LBK60_07165 [Verrucomicrobiales bacterium]|nr:hypothetical protein [Verrucomicrobiales bacterium]